MSPEEIVAELRAAGEVTPAQAQKLISIVETLSLSLGAVVDPLSYPPSCLNNFPGEQTPCHCGENLTDPSEVYSAALTSVASIWESK